MLKLNYLQLSVYLVSTLIIFSIGFYFGNNYEPTNQTSTNIAIDSKEHSYSITSHLPKIGSSIRTVSPLEQLSLIAKFKTEQKITETSKQQIFSIIDSASEEEVTGFLNTFLNSHEIYQEIDDVKTFSKRLLEELSANNSPIDSLSNAQISFSLSQELANSAEQYFEIEANDKIYAHIDTQHGLGSGDLKTFVQWKNLNTGKVLHYKQHRILPNSEKNWVSFTPDGGWVSGEYEISFYQFTATLNKLANNNLSLSVKN